MQRRAFQTGLFAAAALAVGGPSRAQVNDLNDAINKAGRQRMLSQRMAKCYLALGQTVQTASAHRILGASIALFERQLDELQAYAPNATIRTTYAQLETAWLESKTALVGHTPYRDGAEAVLTAAGRVLALAHQGTLQFEALSQRPAGKLVNVAGRQRMLSQRMAAFYLSASWGVQGTQALAEVDKARNEFIQAHRLLKNAPEATDTIRAELDLAEGQFTFFEAALRAMRPGAAGIDAQALTNVFTTSERILQVMDSVTGLYSQLT